MESKTLLTLSKRPERTQRITKEDILNLKIALETSKSMDEFLDRV